MGINYLCITLIAASTLTAFLIPKARELYNINKFMGWAYGIWFSTALSILFFMLQKHGYF